MPEAAARCRGSCSSPSPAGLLSTTMELTQYYIAGRVSAADDVYANLIGTLLGAIVGNFAGGHFLWLPLREIAANRVPCLLLALWLGYRLYPYVPTIDLHKYWDALKPVVFHPRPTGYDLFRYTAIWLTIGSLIESVGGRRRGWLLFPLFIAAVLAAKVLIVGKTLSAAEIGGAAIALAVWLLLAISVSARIRVTATALLFSRLHPCRAAGAVPVQRLRPGVRLDTISQLSVRLGRGQHNVLSRKGLSLRRLDMVARQERVALRGIHHSRRDHAFCRQLGGNLPPRPLGGDHRCPDGSADRYNHRSRKNPDGGLASGNGLSATDV